MSGRRANGYCFHTGCKNRVPEDYSNKFYCGEACRQTAWREHNPGKKEPDWNAPPLPGAWRDAHGNWHIAA